MPRLYLRPVGDDAQFSDAADYAEDTPFPVPSGMEWVPGNPPSHAMPVRKLSLNASLEGAFLNLILKHKDKPYFTPRVAYDVMAAKFGITNANQVESIRWMASMVLRGVPLPTEMEADRDVLVELMR